MKIWILLYVDYWILMKVIKGKVWLVIEHEYGGSTFDDFTLWGVWTEKEKAEKFKKENEELYEYRGMFVIKEMDLE